MDYRIYDPEIVTSTVIDGYTSPLTHAADQTIAYYQGTFFVVCDNSEGYNDAAPGQAVWMSTSSDGRTWSAPFQPFRDSDYCTNPVTIPEWAVDWQPNLVVVGDELWVTWTSDNAYISKLSSPSGKWTNYRFEYVGGAPYITSVIGETAGEGRTLRPVFDSISDWYPFFCQSPTVLKDGTVVCPLIEESLSTLSTSTTNTDTFTRAKKYPVLYKTVNGTDWSAVRIDPSPMLDFASWEPFVVQDRAGNVYTYIRNLDAGAKDEDMLWVAVSRDNAQTFTAPFSTKLLVPSTRGGVKQLSTHRWMMAHVDQAAGSTQSQTASLAKNRTNGAVFFSRRADTDFIPGINFSAGSNDNYISYPSIAVNDGKAFIAYSAERGSDPLTKRRLLVAELSELPDDTHAYVHPRSHTVYTIPSTTTLYDPELVSGAVPYYKFAGNNKLAGVTPCVSSGSATYAAWVSPSSYLAGVVADTRLSALAGVAVTPYFTYARSNYFHGIPFNVPSSDSRNIFLATVIDNDTSTITQYVGDADGLKSSSTAFVGTIDLTGDGPVVVGYKALSGSGLSGWMGRIYNFGFYTSALTEANIKSLYNAKAAGFGYTLADDATAPASPLVLLDASAPNLTEFPSIGAAPAPARCEVIDADTLRIHGEGSASVELPYAVSTVTIRWKLGAVPTGGDKYVVATFGTVDQPCRLYMLDTTLYLNGREVDTIEDPTAYTTTTVTVSSRKVDVDGVEQPHAGKPRMFLGNAYPENLLASTKTIDFDVSAMQVLPTAYLRNEQGRLAL